MEMQDAAASSERAGNAPMAAQGCTNALDQRLGQQCKHLGEMPHSHPVSCLLLSTSNSVDEPKIPQSPQTCPQPELRGAEALRGPQPSPRGCSHQTLDSGIVRLGILNPKSLVHGAEGREGDGTLLLALNKEPASLSSGPDLLSLVPSVLTASPSLKYPSCCSSQLSMVKPGLETQADCLLSISKQHFPKEQTNNAANIPALSLRVQEAPGPGWEEGWLSCYQNPSSRGCCFSET